MRITSPGSNEPENVISSQYLLYLIPLCLHQRSIESSKGFITRFEIAGDAGEP